MQALTVSIVQADLHWHDAQKNREHFANVLHELNDQTDLIVPCYDPIVMAVAQEEIRAITKPGKPSKKPAFQT